MNNNLAFKGVSNLVESGEETWKTKMANCAHVKINADKDMALPSKQKKNIEDMQPSSHRVNLFLMGSTELTRLQRNINPGEGLIEQGERKFNTV